MKVRRLTTRSATIAMAVTLMAGCMHEQAQEKYNRANTAVSAQIDYDSPTSESSAKVAPAARPAREETAQADLPQAAPLAQSEAKPAATATRADRTQSAQRTPAHHNLRRHMHHRRPRKKSEAIQIYRTSNAATNGAEGGAVLGNRDAQGTEDYANYGVNQMTQTTKDAKSTFSIDVDTGSYTIARRKLNTGQIPPQASVRVEEFVNYFRYDYPDPDSGPFGVFMEAAPSPFSAAKNRKILRIGVQGKRVTRSSRKPVHLTFLVDVSGSMQSPDKLGLAQKSLEILTNNLHKGDTVAIATYAGRVAKILDPTGLQDRGRIINAIKSLRAGGSTAMNDGLKLAYKLALTNYKRDDVNRVLVLTDGDANVGPHSHQDILKQIHSYVDEGVTLSTIGFGMGNYKDTMMEQLADKGNGNYYYIDTEKEARKVFGDQLDGTLQVIAKDVKIQVEFEPDAVKSYRLIGYENRDIADKDFRNDKVDAGEIGAGHTVTALYELVLTDKKVNKLATVRIRHKEPQGAHAKEQSFLLTRNDLRDSVHQASKDFQFATAVAGFAEIMRGSPYAKHLSLDLVEEIAKGGTVAGQADREEFIGLVEKAKKLMHG